MITDKRLHPEYIINEKKSNPIEKEAKNRKRQFTREKTYMASNIVRDSQPRQLSKPVSTLWVANK